MIESWNDKIFLYQKSLNWSYLSLFPMVHNVSYSNEYGSILFNLSFLEDLFLIFIYNKSKFELYQYNFHLDLKWWNISFENFLLPVQNHFVSLKFILNFDIHGTKSKFLKIQSIDPGEPLENNVVNISWL